MSIKVNKLAGIIANENDSITLEHCVFDEGTERQCEKFCLNIRDSGLENGATFFFHNPHEARAFLTRALEQLDMFID